MCRWEFAWRGYLQRSVSRGEETYGHDHVGLRSVVFTLSGFRRRREGDSESAADGGGVEKDLQTE